MLQSVLIVFTPALMKIVEKKYACYLSHRVELFFPKLNRNAFWHWEQLTMLVHYYDIVKSISNQVVSYYQDILLMNV